MSGIPWHPVAFGVAYVSLYWVEAAVSPLAAIRALLIVIAAIGLLQVGLSLALRDAGRGALVTSVIVLAAISKVVIRTVATAPQALGAPLAALWLGAIVLAILLVIRIARRARAGWSLGTVNRTLNIFSVALVGVAIVSAVSSGRVAMVMTDLGQGSTWMPTSGSQDQQSGVQQQAPDVYLLLLDGYPSRSALDRVFGFDNTPFLDALEQRGLDVAQDSRSNYLWTYLTMMSMLHGDFVERIPALQESRESPSTPVHPLARQVLNDNPTYDDFREAGYSVIATVNPMERYAMRDADVLIDQGRLNDFELNLLIGTYVGDLVDAVWPAFGSEQHRQRSLDSLHAVPQLAAEPGPPRLVLAHIISPHHPVVWDAEGSPVNPSILDQFYGDTLMEHDLTRDEFVDEYVDQLVHLNRLVLQTLDDLEAAAQAAGRSAVIIVMSDHGSGVGIDPDRADEGDTDERTSNLFAASTPGHPGLFPDDITPVDVMRLLRDAYLGTSYGPVDPMPNGLDIDPDEIQR